MLETLNIDKVVEIVMKEIKMNSMINEDIISSNFKNNLGVFEDMNMAIDAAWTAQKEYAKCSLARRNEIIESIRAELSKSVEIFAQMGVEETGMGRYEDKVLKHKLAIEKSPGVEDLKSDAKTGDGGLTLYEMSPFGVIGSIAPSTNPTETIICNSIGMLAAGNSIVFAPHPSAKNVSILAIEVINKAIEKVNGPKNLVVTIKEPTIDSTNVMIKHEKVNMICATGGPGIVKIALSCGKKAIGAGAGNPPAVVDETADIRKAAKDIIDGCSFDNNLPCIAEKEVIVVDSVADELIDCMRKYDTLEIKDQETLDKLQRLILTDKGTINKEFVGKNADYIAKQIGITIDPSIKVIFAQVDRSHPFVVEELMMPVLPIVRVKDIDEAIELAVEVEHGNRHTAIMHSKNIDNLTRMARAIQTTIFVKNGPSYGGIGYGTEGHTTFTIAGPTGEGLTSARTFTRKRRCVLVEGFSIK
jgi:propionaldehyde dehydrogenase